jgi:hypothetical protein
MTGLEKIILQTGREYIFIYISRSSVKKKYSYCETIKLRNDIKIQDHCVEYLYSFSCI